MNVIDNIVLKEFLLKAYKAGFNDGCHAESEASMGMDYTSEEYKEILHNELICTLAENALSELERTLRHAVRLHIIKTGLLPQQQKSTLNKIMGQFAIPLAKWTALVCEANLREEVISESAAVETTEPVKEEYNGI